MIIIISPTKQMKENVTQQAKSVPVLIEQSKCIVKQLQQLNQEEIQQRMKVNEKIAIENLNRYQKIVFDQKGSCAIDSYHGLQFQYMQIETQAQRNYVQEHVRILSGLYGVVKPMDSIYPYRLEMQAAISVNGSKDIYTFWKDQLANVLNEELITHEEPYLLNLTSKEYEKAVVPYVDQSLVVHILFHIHKNGKLKTESTQVKMARGRMIHYLATHQVKTLQEVKMFDEDGYVYQEEMSDRNHMVFVKEVNS